MTQDICREYSKQTDRADQFDFQQNKAQQHPTTARDFSFDDKPEVITLAFRSAPTNPSNNIVKDSLPSRSTSYLQAKPRSSRTKRFILPETERGPPSSQDSSKIKATPSSAASVSTKATTLSASCASLPKSTSTPSFQAVKSFWAKKSASVGVSVGVTVGVSKGVDSKLAASKPAAYKPADSKCMPTSTLKPSPNQVGRKSTSSSSSTGILKPNYQPTYQPISKPGTVEMMPNRSNLPPCASKPLPLPSSTSTPTFPSAKNFWSELSASSTVGAVVSGSGSTPRHRKPALSPRESSCSSSSRQFPKVSLASSLSGYTLNPGSSSSSFSSTSQPQNCQKKHEPKTITASSQVSTASKNTESCASGTYRTATTNSHLSIYSTPNNTSGTAPNPTAPTSLQAEYIPSVQSELWSQIMDFCGSDISLPLGVGEGM